MLEAVLEHDKALFLWLNQLGSPTWDAFWLLITNKWSAIPLYLFLAFLAYKNLGLKRILWLLVAIVLLILTTDQLANFFKFGVQRLRPCYDPQVSPLLRLVKSSCGGKFGYFSAHAGNSFALAYFFTYLFGKQYRYLGIFLIVWAIMVAYSRIYIGVHYPLDVLSGMAFGGVLSWIFVRLYLKFVAIIPHSKKG